MTANTTLTTQQRSRLAQHDLMTLANSFCSVLVQLTHQVEGSAAQSAGAAAVRYLEVTQVARQINGLGELVQRLSIENDHQTKLFSGAKMRSENALTYLEAGNGDLFEQAQVLVQAVTDLAARLEERGLLLLELSKATGYVKTPSDDQNPSTRLSVSQLCHAA